MASAAILLLFLHSLVILIQCSLLLLAFTAATMLVQRLYHIRLTILNCFFCCSSRMFAKSDIVAILFCSTHKSLTLGESFM